MSLFKPKEPRSKPPASDNYEPLITYSGGGAAKCSARGQMPSGKMPCGGYNPVFSFKSQANTYATRTDSPTSGGGKKVY